MPKNEVIRYLSLIDVSLVNLRKTDTFKSVIPSKIFEAAALCKPILLGLEGETKQLIQEFNCGLCYEPENELEFIDQCKNIINSSNYKSFQIGCKNLAKNFDRKIALKNFKNNYNRFMNHITIVAGARPNFMKIAPLIHEIINKKAGFNIDYSLVHTGQHYDKKMSGDFFKQLDIPDPDVNLDAGGGTHAEQTAAIMIRFEEYLSNNETDLVLVVGDVTSTMACAITSQKLHIKKLLM